MLLKIVIQLIYLNNLYLVNDDFFITGLMTSNHGMGAASTMPSTTAAKSSVVQNMKMASN